MERIAKLTVVLGFNGTGKTTFLAELLKRSGRRCLIVTPHDMEWLDYPANFLTTKDDFQFSGMQRHIFEPGRSGTLSRIGLLRKCIIVFDDCRYYFKTSDSDALRPLFIARRQQMTDIFAVGHGFTEILPVFFTFATDLILFRTQDNIFKRKDSIQRFDEIVALQTEVNRQSETNPYYKTHFKF